MLFTLILWTISSPITHHSWPTSKSTSLILYILLNSKPTYPVFRWTSAIWVLPEADRLPHIFKLLFFPNSVFLLHLSLDMALCSQLPRVWNFRISNHLPTPFVLFIQFLLIIAPFPWCPLHSFPQGPHPPFPSLALNTSCPASPGPGLFSILLSLNRVTVTFPKLRSGPFMPPKICTFPNMQKIRFKYLVWVFKSSLYVAPTLFTFIFQATAFSWSLLWTNHYSSSNYTLSIA